MRLDKWLKITRLVKRRAVANALCDHGKVAVDGRVVRASHAVRIGERVAIDFGPRRVIAEVAAVPSGNITVAAARKAYQVLEETKVPKPAFALGDLLPAGEAADDEEEED